MISVTLAAVEILLIVLGVYLLYWWTNREASDAQQNLKNSMPATEEDFMVRMIESASQEEKLKKAILQRQLIINNGIFKRDTTVLIQYHIIYQATSVGIALQNMFRSNRRAYFADKNWQKYR